MLKVGVYLRSNPGMGGTLQYNLGMLSALQGLSNDEFQVVAAYSGDYWQEKIAEFNVDSLNLGSALFSRASAEIWRWLSLPVSLWRRMAPAWHPVTRLLLRQGCDIWIFPSQDSMAYWVPVRSLATIHDLMHRYERRFEESGSPADFRAREYDYSNISRWSDGILVDSETGRSHVNQSYDTPMEKLFSLPFIPPQYIHRSVSEQDRADLRVKYTLPERFFLYPAQFWAHKNHELLVRALQQNLQQYPDMNLVFCGGRKNNYDHLMQVINEAGLASHVTVIDYLPDDEMAVMYRCAHALLMPTFYGPTNIPPLEAMACGCPCAVSRIYGMPEQLGDAALYFDPLSVDEAATVMASLWSDSGLYQQLQARGHEYTERWNLAAFSKRLGEIIEKITVD